MVGIMTDLACYRQIAALHKRSLPYGFLSSLRIESLAVIYRALDAGHGSVVLTRYDQDVLAGFVAGSISRKAQMSALLSHSLSISMRLIFDPAIYLKFGKMLSIASHFGSTSDARQGLPPAELLSIAVSPEYRGQEYGKELYRDLVSWFEQRDVSEFHIRVGKALHNAQAFYESVGAILVPGAKIGISDETIIFRHGELHGG